MAIFDLSGKISLDSAPFMRGLKDSESSMKDFTQKIANGFENIKNVAATIFTGALVKEGIDAIKSLATETSAAGDAIDKQSQQLGLSRKAYQEWEYILSQSGASIDSMGTSMRTLNTALNSNDDEVKRAFSQLHLSTNNLKKVKPEEALETIVRAFQKLPPSAQKSDLAIKIFGRSGQQLMPLLNSSETSIDEFRGAMEELGLYMSDDAVDASVAYGDALDTMKRTFNSIKYAIGSKVLPVLTNAFQEITGYAGKIKKAYEENGLKGVFDTLVTDIKGIQWPTWDDVKDAFGSAWDTIIQAIPGAVGGLVEKFTDLFQGGADAIEGIDWETVGKNIWAKIKSAFSKVVSFFTGIFGKAENGVRKIKWDELGKSIVRLIKAAFKGIVDYFKGKFKAVSEGIKEIDWKQVGQNVFATIGSAFNGIKEAFKAIFAPGKDGVLEIDWLGLGKSILSTIGAAFDAIKDFFAGLFAPAIDGIHEAFSGIKTWFEDNVITPIAKSIEDIIKPAETILRKLGILAPKALSDEAVKNINASYQHAKNIADIAPFVNTFTKEMTDAGFTLEEINSLLELFKKTNYDPTYINTALEDLTKTETAIDAIKAAAEAASGVYPIDFPVTVGEMPEATNQPLKKRGPGGYFASGEWEVPYNDFPALLHEGEMVLTRSQARDYRDGERGQNINISALMSGIISAVKEGMRDAQVNAYMDGKRVTRETNRITANELRNVRFAR